MSLQFELSSYLRSMFKHCLPICSRSNSQNIHETQWARRRTEEWPPLSLKSVALLPRPWVCQRVLPGHRVHEEHPATVHGLHAPASRKSLIVQLLVLKRILCSGQSEDILCPTSGIHPAAISGLACGSKSKKRGFSWLCFADPLPFPLEACSDREFSKIVSSSELESGTLSLLSSSA